jgi:hypothetical protein
MYHALDVRVLGLFCVTQDTIVGFLAPLGMTRQRNTTSFMEFTTIVTLL